MLKFENCFTYQLDISLTNLQSVFTIPLACTSERDVTFYLMLGVRTPTKHNAAITTLLHPYVRTFLIL